MQRYTEYEVHQAITAVKNGQSIRKASIEWGVPRATLQDRISGREPHRIASEPQQRLSSHQEAELAKWAIAQADLGLPPTHLQLRLFASKILDIKGDTERLGQRWVRSFLKRNPSIQTQRSRRFDLNRINGATSEIIRAWFQYFDLPDIKSIKGSNRWNIDKAGIIEGQGENGLVLGGLNSRQIQKKQPGSRIWTSFLECISATGKSLPPLVIFKGKSVQQQWFPSLEDELLEFKDWEFTATDNGWTNSEIAVEWLRKIFIPRTRPEDPSEKRLLILDGYGSYITTEFI